MEIIDTVAFDLGGVLAYLDFDKLTDEEKYLYKIYMGRFDNGASADLIDYAKSKIRQIVIKLYDYNENAIETLEMLKEEKITPAIWTNGIEEFEAWFESANLYKYIKYEDIINSCYLETMKPQRDFYLKAMNKMGKSFKQILFYDDNYQNILGATNCGIKSLTYRLEDNLKRKVEEDLSRR